MFQKNVRVSKIKQYKQHSKRKQSLLLYNMMNASKSKYFYSIIIILIEIIKFSAYQSSPKGGSVINNAQLNQSRIL